LILKYFLRKFQKKKREELTLNGILVHAADVNLSVENIRTVK
jgi:hypothetical protein